MKPKDPRDNYKKSLKLLQIINKYKNKKKGKNILILNS